MSLIITLLLIAAFLLFLFAGITRFARGWFVPIGLACWVLTALLPRVL